MFASTMCMLPELSSYSPSLQDEKEEDNNMAQDEWKTESETKVI